MNIADAAAMQITDLAAWVRSIDDPSVAPLLRTLQQMLDSFVDIGLGYLSLDRSSGTLSGGEAQRTKMIRHLGSSLTDMTYVFDEPTTGLYPHDIQRMNELLLLLRDKGNTVLVVEHKPEVQTILGRMTDVGLGYLTLGQSLNTLSGGERQRLKLAISMAKKGAVYVLDEPTTGLHLADVEALLGLMDRLVDAGNSLIVIEHHQAVMAHADWIIDVGPGAGRDGGTIVLEGTPADLVAGAQTLTAEHLARYVGA